MLLNSISGFNCHVQDLPRTAAFYEALGFRPGKQEPDRRTYYVNWFSVTFMAQNGHKSDADLSANGTGLFVQIKVDDVDAFYEEVVSKDMTPATEPQKRRGGGREFMLRDPDGYKLVFFEK
jgi:catechol 2,3-dioxygenase-like lactoylglutathione lyase family enzyme